MLSGHRGDNSFRSNSPQSAKGVALRGSRVGPLRPAPAHSQMSLRDGMYVHLRGGIQIPAARSFFEGKWGGANLIQPEARKDWARGGHGSCHPDGSTDSLAAKESSVEGECPLGFCVLAYRLLSLRPKMECPSDERICQRPLDSAD